MKDHRIARYTLPVLLLTVFSFSSLQITARPRPPLPPFPEFAPRLYRAAFDEAYALGGEKATSVHPAYGDSVEG